MKRSFTAAAALGLLLVAGGFAPRAGIAVGPESLALSQRWLAARRSPRTHGAKRIGWSVAQDRRNARKARNVSRNRAAHR